MVTSDRWTEESRGSLWRRAITKCCGRTASCTWSAAATHDGAAVLHVFHSKHVQAVELREHDNSAEVRTVLASQLAAAEPHLGEALRLLGGQSGTDGSRMSYHVPLSMAWLTWCVSPMGDFAVMICSSVTPKE